MPRTTPLPAWIRHLRFALPALFAIFLLAAGPTESRSAESNYKRKPTVKASHAGSRPSVGGPLYATRPEAMEAADDIATRRNLDRDWVRRNIGQARFVPAIAKASAPPPAGVPKNWALYRSRFIEPVRIRAGVQFWQTHAAALQRAEDLTGVPAAIIVGILGVETLYGQQTGNYRVMDALSTLAFDFPAQHPKAAARATFFRAELEEFLVLTARTHTEPLALRGSYAGAMGLPQFMPSSWARYAIDFDGDGRIDLFHSAADVIGSVANYFVAFGWQRGMPTHYPVQWDPEIPTRDTLLAPDIVPSFTVAEFQALGVTLDGAALQHPGKLAMVELFNGDAAPSYVAGTENFYALTRYNWSSYYALAVIELGQEVLAARQR